VRYRYADHVPYAVPESLSDLTGPGDGVLVLPRSVAAPRFAVIDLGERWQVQMGYGAVMSNGDLGEVCGLVNSGLLIRMWPDLVLPRRCAQMWLARFPELGVGWDTRKYRWAEDAPGLQPAVKYRVSVAYVTTSGNTYDLTSCSAVLPAPGNLYAVGVMYGGARAQFLSCAQVPTADIPGGAWVVASLVATDSAFFAGPVS